MNIIDLCTAEEKNILDAVCEVSTKEQIPAYAIGGFVRDKIMGRPTSDIDIVCLGDSTLLAEAVATKVGASSVHIFKNFGVAEFTKQQVSVEIVTARKESYDRHSRKPIVTVGSLEDDFLRRDFTINAIATHLSKENYGMLIDPFGGAEDIKQGRILTPVDPAITFSDDPLRMLRAIRFATQLNFRIEASTWDALVQQRDRLHIISKERICQELHKILMSHRPSIGLELIDQAGLWNFIIPDVPKLKGVEYVDGKGHKDNFYHTLQVVDNVASRDGDLWLRWAALLHDIAKPQTKKFEEGRGWTFHGHDFVGAKMVKRIFRELHLPLNEKMEFVAKMVALHLRPISLTKEEVTDSAVRRLLFDAGEHAKELMILCESDITSKRQDKVEKYMHNFQHVRQRMEEVEEKDKMRNFKLSIDGNQIIETLQIRPSKEVGLIKQAVLDAVLDGLIENTPEATYDYMLKVAKTYL